MKALTSVIGMVFDNVIGSREEERISVINE